MKRISKRIGAMLLIFTMFFQTFGMHVSAAPDTLSGNSITDSVSRDENTEDTYIEPITGIEIPNMEDEVSSYIDEDILTWVEENIPEDKTELESKPKEWFDGLTPSQKRIVDILIASAKEERMRYGSQTLEEVLEILDTEEVSIEKFFEHTALENITLENLYELKELGAELSDLEEAIYGLKGYEGYDMPETDEMLILAMTVSGFSPFAMFALGDGGTSEATTGVTRVNTRNTGYTDGKGNQFWQITDLNGKLVYCLDHGKRCSRTFQ